MEKDETVASLAEIKTAFHELKHMVEKNKLDPEKKARIDQVIDSYEAVNQKLTAAEQKSKEQADQLVEFKQLLEQKDLKNAEFKERLEQFEAELSRKATRTEQDYREAPEYKALNEWTRKGSGEIGAEQKALLRTDAAVSGGFLVTTEMDNVIIKKITEIDGLRAVARVRSISSKAVEMAIRSTIPVATFEGEADSGDDSTATYENVTVTPYRHTFTTPVTQDMLQDAAFNMEAEILADALEGFAYGEGNGFIVGNGNKTPEGILMNATVTAAARPSSASSEITASDVILLTGDLKVGYNPVYLMNRTTLAYLRSLRDTNGQFLWSPGMNGGVANTICGFPYVLCPSMQDHNVTNAYSVAFGDFRRGYTIVDRTGLSIVRDDVTLKKKGIVEFTMNRWLTGKIVLPEAIKLLKSTA